MYEVYVDNIGCVLSGESSEKVAVEVCEYYSYVYGAEACLFKDGDLARQYPDHVHGPYALEQGE